MTQVVTTEFAPPGAHFAPDAFDSSVGKEVPFKVNGQVVGTCTLLGYSVPDHGGYTTMTFEVPETTFSTELAGICVHQEDA
jgi:hypothetical protein